MPCWPCSRPARRCRDPRWPTPGGQLPAPDENRRSHANSAVQSRRTLMPEPDVAGPVAAYARGCLAAARCERDWMREAVARLEADGQRIVLTEQPATIGGAWMVLDWRTGETLATITGGQDDYEAAWSPGWTDVCWIDAWLEDLAEDGQLP